MPFALNQNLVISPLYCDYELPGGRNASMHCVEDRTQRVRIFNKMRERFELKILASLRLENIVIDSLDSILPRGHPCLSEYRQCCGVTYSAVSHGVSNLDDSDTSLNCSQAFESLGLTDQCQFGEQRTLFKMISTNEKVYYERVENNQLQVVNSELRSFCYSMNSMVNRTMFGGRIEFTNSKVTGINICGSIIKNYFSMKPET